MKYRLPLQCAAGGRSCRGGVARGEASPHCCQMIGGGGGQGGDLHWELLATKGLID